MKCNYSDSSCNQHLTICRYKNIIDKRYVIGNVIILKILLRVLSFFISSHAMMKCLQYIIYSRLIIELMEEEKTQDLEDIYFHKLNNHHEVHYHLDRIESILFLYASEDNIKNVLLTMSFLIQKKVSKLLWD